MHVYTLPHTPAGLLGPARGVLAGAVATLVISMLALMRLSMGIMSWFHPGEVMNLTAQALLATPDSIGLGWVLHVLVGTLIWGMLYGVVADRLPAWRPAVRGLLYGVGVWLLVMITVFPLAGTGFFATGYGVGGALVILFSHLIYGGVLGAAYAWLRSL